MDLERASGILLHPTSLPGRFGVGDLGGVAHRFVDFLQGAGQSVWQMLPVTPTGIGDSPYQSPSAFAGNVLLLSPETLRDEGLLAAEDLAAAPVFPEDAVDYQAVEGWKRGLLDKAFATFEAEADPASREAFQAFCREEAAWLDDWALFSALKDAHPGAWTDWPRPLALREGGALDAARQEHARAIQARRFWQHLFFRQWRALHEYARAKGVRIMGDLPIFVAHDSADVWAHPELFELDAEGRPRVQAGVPPDYFSATGQCWGNPLYRWEEMGKTGFAWWIARFRALLRHVDLVRVDHFRGFEAYWEIPGGEETAVNGRWVKAPGAELFAAVKAALGELPIVAENLGTITPEVEELRGQFGFPGMAVLQFVFHPGRESEPFRPHNFVPRLVVYTGTHDNDTTLGWWRAAGASTQGAEEAAREREFARRYVGASGDDLPWAFVRTALASVAMLAVLPLQDVLGMGSEARMNLPGRPGGNWRWRVRASQLTDQVGSRLRELAELYGRTPSSRPAPTDSTGGR